MGFTGLVLLVIGIILVGISKNFNDNVDWRVTNIVLFSAAALSFFEDFSQQKPLCFKIGVLSTTLLLLSIVIEILPKLKFVQEALKK